MDEEIDRALAAARDHPTVARHVERAVAIARFKVRDLDGPYRYERLSDGVPQEPVGPMFPAFTRIPATPLTEALEALQSELVWQADCAEFTDANLNSAQYLRAAGRLDLAARAALALAGPGLALVLDPPRRVWDLAASLGLELDDLLPPGERALGSLPPNARGVDATFAWDVHHEEPPETPEQLGPRELTSYRAAFAHGRAKLEAALRAGAGVAGEPRSGGGEAGAPGVAGEPRGGGGARGAPRVVAGRREYGAFFVDDAETDAFVLEWYADTPDWAVPPVETATRAGAVAALVAGTATPEVLEAAGIVATGDGSYELRPPMAALELARALAAEDAFAHTVDVHMSSWRLATRAGELPIEAMLDGRAHGEPVAGLQLPAARTAVLADGDLVRYLRLRR